MNIYVGNLPYSISEGDLETLFSDFGSVAEAKIITDRDSGRSKGFGFVEMPEQSEGEEAIKELDGREVEGRNIKVNEARPKQDKPRNRSRY
ncbi:RNA recognition motif domain-containing protein [Spirochaetota bacterium]